MKVEKCPYIDKCRQKITVSSYSEFCAERVFWNYKKCYEEKIIEGAEKVLLTPFQWFKHFKKKD